MSFLAQLSTSNFSPAGCCWKAKWCDLPTGLHWWHLAWDSHRGYWDSPETLWPFAEPRNFNGQLTVAPSSVLGCWFLILWMQLEDLDSNLDTTQLFTLKQEIFPELLRKRLSLPGCQIAVLRYGYHAPPNGSKDVTCRLLSRISRIYRLFHFLDDGMLFPCRYNLRQNQFDVPWGYWYIIWLILYNYHYYI